MRDALTVEARTYRSKHRIDDTERLLEGDVNAIRHAVSVRLGVSLLPVERQASDSHAGGNERDPLWAFLLERAWRHAWLEYDGKPPCCRIDNFAAHGEVGYRLLEDAERRAASDLHDIAADKQRVPRKVA